MDRVVSETRGRRMNRGPRFVDRDTLTKINMGRAGFDILVCCSLAKSYWYGKRRDPGLSLGDLLSQQAEMKEAARNDPSGPRKERRRLTGEVYTLQPTRATPWRDRLPLSIACLCAASVAP